MEKNNEQITIRVRLPMTWADLDEAASEFGLLNPTLTREIRRCLKEVLVNEYIKKIEFPEITVDKEEVKKEIISKMAEKALEKYED